MSAELERRAREWTPRIVLGVGVALVAAAVVLAFLRRAFGLVFVVGILGLACILIPLVQASAEEGRFEATRTGFRLYWRKEVRERVAAETGVGTEAAESESREGGTFPLRPFAQVQYADVNNDGEDELLVQHPVGAHSMALKVFGWRDGMPLPEFVQLAETVSPLGLPFTIGDLDGDKHIELATIEPDWNVAGANMAAGPFVETLYRWDGADFREVNRRSLGVYADIRDAQLQWYKDEPEAVP